MIVRARAPLRISFGGGGTDVPPYCDERGGVILNATINRYAYATLVPNGSGKITVRSLDYDASIEYGLEDEFIYDGQLDLAKGAVDYFRRTYGITEGMEIFLHNDAPPGSGLGSSSAIMVALLAALATYSRLALDAYAIANLAYTIERVELGQKGGKQDQYAAAFGGFSFMEFQDGGALINTLRLPFETIYELEYSLAFAYVGSPRMSSHIIEKQVRNFTDRQSDAVAAMDEVKRLAYEMKRALLHGHLVEMGSLLHEGWLAKTRMAEGISTDHIATLYTAAREAGALGGKVSGAGGGGFMFFLCDPYRRFSVQEALREGGAQVVDFSFSKNGVRSWITKEA